MTQASDILPRIQNEIIEYVAGEILRDSSRTIGLEEPLISSGLIDSFHLVDLALFVESAFGVRIDDTELSASVFDTVLALAELIVSRMPGEIG
jgi:acyl carrier protein